MHIQIVGVTFYFDVFVYQSKSCGIANESRGLMTLEEVDSGKWRDGVLTLMIIAFCIYQYLMQAVAPTSIPPPSGKRKLGWFLLLVVLGAVFAVFYFGGVEVHQGSPQLLYDTFDVSPEHAKLLKQLKKGKLSILWGKKEDGLFQFAEHFANKLVLDGRTVFLEDVGQDNYVVYQLAKSARVQLDELLGIEQGEGDWIVTSQNGELIPESVISKIREGNPKSKILIVTTSRRQLNAGFKVFELPQMEQHQIEESIQRNFKVSENTADIIYDYFGSAEGVLKGMNFEQFSQEAFLGENYRSLDELDKEDNRILKDLCKKGEGNSEGERPKLTELGVIFFEGENYWLNAEARLNYELHKNLNCINKLVSEEILQAVEEEKERLAAEQQQKAEEEKEKSEAKEPKKKGKKGKGKKSSEL